MMISRRNKSNSNGITLVSLVITIIILLILVNIVIMAVFNEGDILTHSKNAKMEMKEKQYEETISLSVKEKNITDYTNLSQELYDVLKQNKEIEGVEKSEDKNIVYVRYETQIWTVYSTGVIIKEKVDIWDGTIDNNGLLGTGIQEDPFQINTAEQLAYFAQQVNSGNKYDNTYVSLNISIDLNYLQWIVIGGNLQNSTSVTDVSSSNMFNGIFLGNNHNIYNLVAKYELSAAVGLFGALGADGNITDLGVKSGDIEGRLLVGSVCGVNYGEINNCTNYAKVTARSYNEEDTNGNYSGGITGYNMGGNIINCVNNGNITSTNGNNVWNGGWAAGIAGYSNGNIYDSINNGEINAKHYRAGGIVGTFQQGEIKNCTNTGEIYSGWRGAGGIVGLCSDGGVIYDSINKGHISAETDEAGGIAGDVSGNINDNGSYSIIRGCTNYGIVQADKRQFAGIAGVVESTGDLIEYCTNYGDIYGLNEGTILQYDAAGIVGFGSGVIRECVNNGNIITYGQSTGGILGRGYGIIEKCVNTGDVTVYKDEQNSSTSAAYVGGVVGYLKLLDGIENKIISCENKGKVVSELYVGGIVGASIANEISESYNWANVKGTTYVGGIVGYAKNVVSICSNNSEIQGSANYIGGIAGSSAEGNIEDCINYKDVEAGANMVGGIVGNIQTAGNTIIRCINKGNIHASGYMSGGISGRNKNDTIITECENHGNISADASICGGISGYSYGGITYSRNYGNISSESKEVNSSKVYPNTVGGIVGALIRANVEYVYNEGNVSIKNNSGVIDVAGGIAGVVGGEAIDAEPLPNLIYAYNKGQITGEEYVANVAGQQMYENRISYSYYLSTLSGRGVRYIGSDIVNYVEDSVEDKENITEAISNDFIYSDFIDWIKNGGIE